MTDKRHFIAAAMLLAAGASHAAGFFDTFDGTGGAGQVDPNNPYLITLVK